MQVKPLVLHCRGQRCVPSCVVLSAKPGISTNEELIVLVIHKKTLIIKYHRGEQTADTNFPAVIFYCQA